MTKVEPESGSRLAERVLALQVALDKILQHPAEIETASGERVVPMVLVVDTRGYIEKVALQINECYERACYDACAVLMRRVLETVIIELYEHEGKAQLIKDTSGDFFMLKRLIATVLKDNDVSLSRNVKKALPDLKDLGDLSAHSRRFVAKRHDIDDVQKKFRISLEEFLYLAKLRR